MATLIYSECQAGKTSKVLEVIKGSLGSRTLTIVLTQANSKLSVEQFVQRAAAADVATQVYDTNNSPSSNQASLPNTHTMIVGFHHKKHENTQVKFLRATQRHWSNVILVIDEVDEGGLSGVTNRLEYISRVEAACGQTPLRLILITATIANFSKQILKIAEESDASGIVKKILNTPCVECVFASPPSTYVGYRWFVDKAWVPLELPPRPKGNTHEDYIKLVEQCVIDKFCNIEDAYKELSLISVSHKINDHGRLGTRLLNAGFNVSIPYNAKHQDAIEVYYKSTLTGNTKLWLLPHSKLSLQQKHYTHSHVLQAAVFMNTDAETRIKEFCIPQEFARLVELSTKMAVLRPKDFPTIPRLALVAGRKAGRGITFQNPSIDFVCTSFCFAHVKDATQRGAINTQKLGRAFGALEHLVTRPGRQPLLIATKQLLVDAGTNRDTLDVLDDPSKLIALKDLIPADVFAKYHFKNRQKIDSKLMELQPEMGVGTDPKTPDLDEDGVVDGVSLKKLRNWINDESLLVGSMLRYLVRESAVSFDQFKEGIKYVGTDDGFESNIKNGVGVKSSYGKLWTYRSKKIYLNPKIEAFIQKWCKDVSD